MILHLRKQIGGYDNSRYYFLYMVLMSLKN